MTFPIDDDDRPVPPRPDMFHHPSQQPRIYNYENESECSDTHIRISATDEIELQVEEVLANKDSVLGNPHLTGHNYALLRGLLGVLETSRDLGLMPHAVLLAPSTQAVLRSPATVRGRYFANMLLAHLGRGEFAYYPLSYEHDLRAAEMDFCYRPALLLKPADFYRKIQLGINPSQNIGLYVRADEAFESQLHTAHETLFAARKREIQQRLSTSRDEQARQLVELKDEMSAAMFAAHKQAPLPSPYNVERALQNWQPIQLALNSSKIFGAFPALAHSPNLTSNYQATGNSNQDRNTHNAQTLIDISVIDNFGGSEWEADHACASLPLGDYNNVELGNSHYYDLMLNRYRDETPLCVCERLAEGIIGTNRWRITASKDTMYLEMCESAHKAIGSS